MGVAQGSRRGRKSPSEGDALSSEAVWSTLVIYRWEVTDGLKTKLSDRPVLDSCCVACKAWAQMRTAARWFSAVIPGLQENGGLRRGDLLLVMVSSAKGM